MPSSLEIESFLNKHLQDQYPGEGRNSIKKLDFSSEDFSKWPEESERKLDLSDFTNLEELKCDQMVLTELIINNCSQLKKLHCGSNSLTNLDLSGNPDLTELICYFNKLTNLDLTENSNLEEVDIRWNKITTDLNIFSHLTKLKVLNLHWDEDYLSLESEENLEINNFSGSLENLKNCQNLERFYLTCQSRIWGDLEFLPTNNLTIFEYKGSQFVELLKPFEFEKGNVKYSIIAAVLSNINSNKKDQIIKIFQDLIQTKREKDRTITDLSKENLILISLRLVEAQNFKRLIIIAIIGWLISFILVIKVFLNRKPQQTKN